MAKDEVKNVQFSGEYYPTVVAIGNELAELENRKPHDSLRILIEQEGQKKIEQLKEKIAAAEQLIDEQHRLKENQDNP